MMTRKSFAHFCNVVAVTLMLLVTTSVACNVPPEQYADDIFIYGVNTYVHHTGTGPFYNQSIGGAHETSFPATVWLHAVINRSGGGFTYTPYIACMQYKIKRPTDADYGKWITVKTIINQQWLVDFPDGPVAYFTKNTLEIPDAPKNSEIIVRVYFGTEVSLSADPNDDTDETGHDKQGNKTWSQKHVVKLISNGNRRVQ